MINKNDRYFFVEDGARKGPVSAESLANVVRYGALTGESLVQRLGETEIKKLSDTDFARFLGGPRPAAPARPVNLAAEIRAALRRPRQWLLRKFSRKYYDYQVEVWRKYYGEFDEGDYSAATVKIEGSEVGYMPGEFVVWLREVLPPEPTLLFAGDSRSSAGQMARAMGAARHTTAGLLDVDHAWDFNDDMPAGLPRVDAVVSLSMLEHILAPYTHLKSLASLLNPGGHIMIYTCAPGFDYHRYPIDTLRFHIDWFEEAALKLGLTVVRKKLIGHGIIVLLRLG